MEYYSGEKDIRQLMDFIEKQEPNGLEPMPPEEIALICAAFPDKKLPQQYLDFLARAGHGFIGWTGSDYVLVENGKFLDMREWIQEEEADDACFRQYGFDYADCCVFFSHQGYHYHFFRFGEGDDPTVYDVDSCAIGEPSHRPAFTELMIGAYNSHVWYRKQWACPWSTSGRDYDKTVWRQMEYYHFEYPPERNAVSVPYPHDVYMIDKSRADAKKWLEWLHPVLMQSLGKITSLLIDCGTGMYYYYPEKGMSFDLAYSEEEAKANLYADGAFLLDRDYLWGWFTVGGCAVIFGEPFRSLIAENPAKYALIPCDDAQC